MCSGGRECNTVSRQVAIMLGLRSKQGAGVATRQQNVAAGRLQTGKWADATQDAAIGLDNNLPGNRQAFANSKGPDLRSARQQGTVLSLTNANCANVAAARPLLAPTVWGLGVGNTG